MAGLLVVVEGIEASGKSTQVQRVAAELKLNGYDVIAVREPGGTPVGDAIRGIFIEHFESLHREVEIALLLSAKKTLLEDVIRPALQQNKIVICDRSIATLIAYQHGGKGIDLKYMMAMHELMDTHIVPDLSIYLNISLAQSTIRLNRRQADGGEYNVIDKQVKSFHERVMKTFDEIMNSESELASQVGLKTAKVVLVDGEREMDAITQTIVRLIVDDYSRYQILPRT